MSHKFAVVVYHMLKKKVCLMKIDFSRWHPEDPGGAGQIVKLEIHAMAEGVHYSALIGPKCVLYVF
jgi:hypothetical protein